MAVRYIGSPFVPQVKYARADIKHAGRLDDREISYADSGDFAYFPCIHHHSVFRMSTLTNFDSSDVFETKD